MRAVEAGYQVVGFDINAVRIKRLVGCESYVEDVPDGVVGAAVGSGRYLPTIESEDCRDFDYAVITVPTPLRDGLPDLSHIEDAAKTLAPLVSAGSCVVLESTTYPGTTDELLVPTLEAGSGLIAGQDFFVGYSPERVDPGNRTWRLDNTPKVISGIDPRSLAVVDAFYSTLVQRTVPVGSTREAELTKLIENTFRHSWVSDRRPVPPIGRDKDRRGDRGRPRDPAGAAAADRSGRGERLAGADYRGQRGSRHPLRRL
jgi:nucleotide sugar dehydrogenase